MNSLLKITRVRPNTFLKQYFSVESDEKVCRQLRWAHHVAQREEITSRKISLKRHFHVNGLGDGDHSRIYATIYTSKVESENIYAFQEIDAEKTIAPN